MPNVRLSSPDTKSFDIFRAVYPVAAADPDLGGQLKEPKFYGTAFAIAPGLFLTAAHVMHNAKAAGVPILMGQDGSERPLGAAAIGLVEYWANDVALLHTSVLDKVTLFDKWLFTRCQVLEDLSAFGFPHAITREEGEPRLTVVFRAYKGHVITTRAFDRLPGKPAVYEVCSAFPEGLSGGPVLWRKDDELYLVGIVLGEQTVQYGRIKNRVGIALPVDQFIACKSEKLDRTLGELVSVRGLTQLGTPASY